MKRIVFLLGILAFPFAANAENSPKVDIIGDGEYEVCDFTVDSIHYSIVDDSSVEVCWEWRHVPPRGSVTVHKGYDFLEGSDLVIPSEVTYNGKTYSVVSIWPGLFYRMSFKSVTLPSTMVAKLHNGCSLENTFGYCSELETVNLPPVNVTMGVKTFTDCTSLKNIDLSYCEHMDNRCFMNCEQLETVSFAAQEVFLGNECFLNAGLTSVNFSPSIEKLTIGQGCFSLTKLESIYIPVVDTSIWSYAFASCLYLKHVTVGCKEFYHWGFIGCTQLELTLLPTTQILDEEFLLNNMLKSIVCYAPVPPIWKRTVHYNNEPDYTLPVAYVPEEYIDLYRAADYWKDMVIIPLESTDISEMETNQSRIDNDDWYNVYGQKVSSPGKGLYIHHGKKVLIK